MKILFFLLSLSSSLIARGQVLEKHISRSTFNSSLSMVTDGDEIFLNVSKNNYFELGPKENMIIKLDGSLNILDSLDLNGFDRQIPGHYVLVQRLLSNGNDTIIAIINQYYPDSTFSGMSYSNYTSSILFMHKNLSIFDTISLKDDSASFQALNILHEKNQWIVTGIVRDTTNNKGRPFIKIFDSDLAINETHEYQSLTVNNTECGISELQKLNDKYIAKLDESVRKFALIDSNFTLIKSFNAIDSIEPNFYFSGYGNFIERSQGNPIYIGTAFREVWGAIPIPPYFDRYWYIGVGQIDSTGKIQQIDSLSFSGFNYRISPDDPFNTLTPVYGFLDSRIPDSTIFSVTGQTYFYFNYTDSIPNQIFIYNFNANTKQLNWLKVYESGFANSVITHTASLPKNQFLIVMNEYDWSLPYENLRVHLMILNGNGDILNEGEFSSRGPKFIVTYPNPFFDQVHVNLPENDSSQRIHFELIDLFGKTIRSGILGETHTIEALENIPSGSYILHFSTEKGDTWISKVIKE